jgi:hypothetical protein
MLIIDERSNKTAALDCGRGIELRPEVERVALEVRPASLLRHAERVLISVRFFMKDGGNQYFVFRRKVVIRDLIEGCFFDLASFQHDALNAFIEAINRALNTNSLLIVERNKDGLRLKLILNGQSHCCRLASESAGRYFSF